MSAANTTKPDWPKLGPSLLIATCLIVAIRTAKWPARRDDRTSDREIDIEIEHVAGIAGRRLAHLIRANEVIFPYKKEPWFKPDGKDQPE
jgi:hypothetical protein